MGYTQNFDIWHGASLGTLIMIWVKTKKDHVRTMFWPFLGKRATGLTQQSEIWHGASLGTLIMIQEKTIWRTMWGPCFGHKRALFWPFLGKGDYGIHPEFWHLAWIIPRHIDYDSRRTNLKEHMRTMFWSYEVHILAISRKRGQWDTPRILKFGMDHPWEHWLWFRKNQFEGPCEDHFLVITGPYFGHF